MWRLAWRNLWRNRTRTLITGSAIAFTLALRLFSVSTADAMYSKMMDGAMRAAGGHVLVQGYGWWQDRIVDIRIEHPEEVLRAVRDVEGVEAAIPRVIVTGLLASPRGNAGVELHGVVPEQEKRLQDWSRYVTEGTFLAGDDVDNPIVLGRKLVEDLGLELGKRVVATVTDPNGDPSYFAFRLGGVIDTGSEMADQGLAYVRLPSAQKAAKLGDSLTQIGVVVHRPDDRAAVKDRIAKALAPREVWYDVPSWFEVLTWDEAMPELVGFIEVDAQWNHIMSLVIFIVVAFGIVNTFLMAVIERIRELGLLGALGMTPGRTAGLVLTESLLLGLVSITVGLGIGLAIHAYVSTEGIDIAAMSGSGQEIAGVILDDFKIRTELVPLNWLRDSAVVLALVVLSAMYPAWRATRLQPADAMRTYE